MRFLYLAIICLLLGSCAKKVTETPIEYSQIKLHLVGPGQAAMPQATAFRMNGNYADNVAVTLNPDGSLAYYPAPSDIMANSAPFYLGDGWWLNRQGISQNSVFTKWTFSEYKNLKTTPERQEIIDAIIPGSAVIEMIQLPVSLSEALRNPDSCKKFVK